MAIKKMGIDLGNFGIKVVTTWMEPFMFEARTKEYDESEYPMGGVKVLSYDDKNLVLGDGDFDHENKKVKRSNLKDCLTGAIAQACEDKDEVIIGVGLPADQYLIDKEDMKKILSFKGDRVTVSYGDPKMEEVVKKTIYIKDIIVMPESLAAYWALEEELVEERTSEIIMNDIGGRTTDLCTIKRNIDGTVTPFAPKTEALGTLKAYELMSTHFTKLAQNKDIDYTFSTEIIESYVEKGLDLGEMFDFIDKEGYVKQAYKNISDKIARFIKRSNPEYGKALIVTVGGGGSKMGKYVKEHFPNNCKLVNDIYCNAKGFLKGVEQLTEDLK